MLPSLETPRLQIRPFTLTDADFILTLLNEPSFLRYIGDKQVRNLAQARDYLAQGPLTSYQRHGLGLCLVSLRAGLTPIGMCGLIRRVELDAPDLGYAFLPAYWQAGYAAEAAGAVLAQGVAELGLTRVLGVTLPDNAASQKLLQRLGFALIGTQPLYGQQNQLYEYRP
ncbi:GNAT family N-acetyltransferase [Pseudaeromonas paramecii]|uniref:GNAT family N-acetyltransferase n=1 Tax=Pseudaeromonas paramecii TaxID=2138166 RepID=A0ABP8PYH9_9GAMM